MIADWDLDPRRWPQQMGAHLDAGTELIDGTCSDCGRREGVRIVMEDPKVATPGSFLLMCTRCLVYDHQHRSWRWEAVARKERARRGAREDDLVPA